MPRPFREFLYWVQKSRVSWLGGDGKAVRPHGIGLGRDGQGGNGQDDGGQGAAQGSFHPFRFLSLQITGCYFGGEGLSPRRPP